MISPQRSQMWRRVILEAQLARGRLFAGAVTALSLMTGALFATPFTAGARAESCDAALGLAVLPSPLMPWTGAPLRVIVATEKPLAGELSLVAPDGRVAATSHDRLDGPPYVWFAEVASPAAGTWHATLTRNDTSGECAKITHNIAVSEAKPAAPGATPGSLWPLRASWNRGTENLFSAWIEKLFDAPLDKEPSWPALYNVLRDKSRNMLFNSLGLGEDEIPMALKPDCTEWCITCAPISPSRWGCRSAIRGARTAASRRPARSGSAFVRCARPSAKTGRARAASFARYLPVVGDAVQSGAVRTLASDDKTDFYTVPLTQGALRPGTIYADPYGHVLMLVRRVPQADGKAGVFLAVDAEPDGSVTRKRFWRGNFLFAQDATLGSPGFKRFRPIVRSENGTMRPLTNAEIAKNPQYGDFSLEQSKLGVEEFYDRMDEVMSPEPLDPLGAMKEAITSLKNKSTRASPRSKTDASSRTAAKATPACRTARRSSRPAGRGRTSPRRRATSAC